MLIWRAARSFAQKAKIRWVYANGEEIVTEVDYGKNLLVAAHEGGINLEGACECSLACSTCHVVLEDEVYDKLEEPVPDEEDLLDLAFGLTPTSRLGCQVIVDERLEGALVQIPEATVNLYVDGHVPKPH